MPDLEREELLPMRLYFWAKDELHKGNRLKASRIIQVARRIVAKRRGGLNIELHKRG